MTQLKHCILLLVLSITLMHGYAQNTSARYEIDAKRIGVTTAENDALPRSREFIRLDSTYYVGYYYEGMFKYNRAADYLGYRNCISPLRKALLLYEKDFKGYLVNLNSFFTSDHKLTDIQQICNALYDSYSNIEEADSAMAILDEVHSWNLQYDFMEYHIKAAWTIHRNRYYLHKYAFLKNSVRENEDIALAHLYEAKSGGDLNANFYLAIIYNYLQNIDSTEYYYNYLISTGAISYNNYAHYKNTLGQFADAINNFEREKFSFDKRLIEAYYFLPTLYINSGNPAEGIRQTNEIIAQNGSTPGFGWYNIALARSYLYDGQLDSAEKAITKAAQFKELHLGTTLGQAQYDFAINVVKMMLVNQEIARIKFYNKDWWYSVTDLLSITQLVGERFLLQFAVVNEFANNPERQGVVYNLFSSENVIGFDEIFNMIRDISPSYFTALYHQKMIDEKRANIRRYMAMFYGKLLYIDGSENESKKTLENILYNTLLDTAHEKLFLARVAETLALQYKRDGETDKFMVMLAFYFKEFPQLIPFSGLKIKARLSTTGLDDEVTSGVVKELKNCSMDWVGPDERALLSISLNFKKKKDKYILSFWIQDVNGQTLLPTGSMIFKSSRGAGKELALRLFGVGGPPEFERL